jgi:hypothetical protein
MPSLQISNVSYALLEHQRLTLGTIDQKNLITDIQMDSIEGILNMLDTWSDTEYYLNGKEPIASSGDH